MHTERLFLHIIRCQEVTRQSIGGTGEQKTLRFVAKYGDACNLFARMGDEVLRHKLDVLRGHCDDLSRPYEEIEKTSLDRLYVSRDGAGGSMSPQQAIDSLCHLAEMGFDQADPGQDPRGAPDLMPICNVLDSIPEGRGTDWYPQLEYSR